MTLILHDEIKALPAPDVMTALRNTTFALESVLMLAAGNFRPAAVVELTRYLNSAKAAIAQAEAPNAATLECLKGLLKDVEASSQGVSARKAVKPNKWQTAHLARVANARAIITKAETGK
jgi:hypothetical protein